MPRECRETQTDVVKVDARVAQVAAGQWGVVDLDDLRGCGLSQQTVAARVRAGRLYPRYRGVFSLLPTVPLEGAFLAAVKACGAAAVLSHFAAAVLWGLLKWDYRDPEVTAPTLRVHPGIRTHRSADIERVFRRGIPVTPPLRTVIDLAATPTVPDTQLRRAVNEALNQRMIKPHEIITSHHRGAKRLRAMLETAVPTRNEFEDAVNALLEGLPRPDVNASEGRYVPDFRWTEQKLILEADSKQFHGHILAREYDRTRQAELQAQGWRVQRVTWKQLTREPTRTRARVEEALRR